MGSLVCFLFSQKWALTYSETFYDAVPVVRRAHCVRECSGIIRRDFLLCTLESDVLHLTKYPPEW